MLIVVVDEAGVWPYDPKHCSAEVRWQVSQLRRAPGGFAVVDARDCRWVVFEPESGQLTASAGAWRLENPWWQTEDTAVCRTCGAFYGKDGDGWDDECGDCADRSERDARLATD